MCSTAGSEKPSYSDGTTAISEVAMQLAQLVVADAVHEPHPVAEGQLADEPLGRPARVGLADHGEVTSRSVASLATARSSVATPFIGESALATATIEPGASAGAAAGWK